MNDSTRLIKLGLPENLIDRLEAQAKEEGRSLQDMIYILLNDATIDGDFFLCQASKKLTHWKAGEADLTTNKYLNKCISVNKQSLPI